jgi:hypothetical protein
MGRGVRTENDIMAREAPQPLPRWDVPKGFDAWLPKGEVGTRVALLRDDGRWYALAEDYGVTAMGDSPHDALCELSELVESYLVSIFLDGLPYTDAFRPVPLSRLQKIEARLGDALLRVLARGLDTRLPIPRERRIALPQLAACHSVS